MPSLKTYDLFLSHAWKYNEDYYRLEKMLKKAPNFYFRNYSVPTHDPLIDPKSSVGRNKLTGLLDNQVKPVNCVVILSGMYVAYSDWILKEIEIAKSYDKPIVGVIPWGKQNIPKVVQDNSHAMVGWNTSTIIEAIRTHSL